MAHEVHRKHGGRGKRAQGEAWRERYLVNRASDSRLKRGLSPTIEDVSDDPVMVGAIRDESMAFIDYQNALMADAVVTAEPPNWTEILIRAAHDQKHLGVQISADAKQRISTRRHRVVQTFPR